MFLLDLLFGKKNRAHAAAPSSAPPRESAHAPGTAIHHDPGLVESLRSEHTLLLEIFRAIDAAAGMGDLAEVEQRLRQFGTVLTGHLLKENVRLYVYLEHLLTEDGAKHRLVHEFRHEMDRIGRTVVAFLDKYKSIASEPALHASFSRDLLMVGEALSARIRREEANLYPMYQPPASDAGKFAAQSERSVAG